MTQERHIFTDGQWQRIEPSMPLCKGRPGGAQRTFFNALLWMARTGAAWRDLPERLGKWNVVYQRYAYWCDKGHFERLFQGVQQPDTDEVMVDSTCCSYARLPTIGAPGSTSSPQSPPPCRAAVRPGKGARSGPYRTSTHSAGTPMVPLAQPLG